MSFSWYLGTPTDFLISLISQNKTLEMKAKLEKLQEKEDYTKKLEKLTSQQNPAIHNINSSLHLEINSLKVQFMLTIVNYKRPRREV